MCIFVQEYNYRQLQAVIKEKNNGEREESDLHKEDEH